MNSIHLFKQPVALLATLAGTFYPFSPPASALPAATPQLAQRLRAGECQAVRESTFVFNERSNTSVRIRSLYPNERVTLADEGINGWAAISAPIAGFIQVSALKPCTSEFQGQCRAALQSTFVFDNPGSGTRIRSLTTNERVTLADDPRNGWILISAPIRGYVRTAELKPCLPVATTPNITPPVLNPPISPPQFSFCRQVTEIVGEGLNIRSYPSLSANPVGTVMPGDVIRLRTNPPPLVTDESGRSWVEIVLPVRGWLSDGYANTDRANLEPTPCP